MTPKTCLNFTTHKLVVSSQSRKTGATTCPWAGPQPQYRCDPSWTQVQPLGSRLADPASGHQFLPATTSWNRLDINLPRGHLQRRLSRWNRLQRSRRRPVPWGAWVTPQPCGFKWDLLFSPVWYIPEKETNTLSILMSPIFWPDYFPSLNYLPLTF